jgi:hypothetical protein
LAAAEVALEADEIEACGWVFPGGAEAAAVEEDDFVEVGVTFE